MAEEREAGAALLLQSLYRRRKCTEALRQLRKREAHRNQVVQEILKTEQLYVSNLRVVVGVFLNPLRSSIAGPEPVCTHDELKMIFSNVEAIYALNNNLLQSISRRISNWGPTQCLGDVFLLMTPYLKMYTEYCNNYENALSSFMQCLESDSFRFFMNICTSFPEANNLTFASFLIMPVQRIPRYNLLLKDLLKHTNEEHPDYKSLSEAVQKMQEVANYVNFQMKIAQSMKSISRIIEEIGADSDLYKVGRIFIKEGRVKQATTKGVRKIFMYLFSDCLTLAVKLGQGVMKKKQFCYWRTIDLPGCWAVPANDGSSIKNIFNFVICGESLTFFADSPETRAEWIGALNETIDKLNEQHPERKKEKYPYIVDAKLEQKLKQMVDDDPDDEEDPQEGVSPARKGSAASSKYRTLPRKLGSAQERRASIIPDKPLPAVPSRSRKPPLSSLGGGEGGGATLQTQAATVVKPGSKKHREEAQVLERTISTPIQRVKLVMQSQTPVMSATPVVLQPSGADAVEEESLATKDQELVASPIVTIQVDAPSELVAVAYTGSSAGGQSSCSSPPREHTLADERLDSDRTDGQDAIEALDFHSGGTTPGGDRGLVSPRALPPVPGATPLMRGGRGRGLARGGQGPPRGGQPSRGQGLARSGAGATRGGQAVRGAAPRGGHRGGLPGATSPRGTARQSKALPPTPGRGPPASARQGQQQAPGTPPRQEPPQEQEKEEEETPGLEEQQEHGYEILSSAPSARLEATTAEVVVVPELHTVTAKQMKVVSPRRVPPVLPYRPELPSDDTSRRASQKQLPQPPQRPVSPRESATAPTAGTRDSVNNPPPYRVRALESMERQTTTTATSPEKAQKSTFVKRVFGKNPRDSFKFNQPILAVPSDMPVMMEGFLAKKGKINRAWKRRYFKLVGGHLFYFKSKSDNNPLGSVALMEAGTVLEEPNPPSAREHAFQLTENGRPFLLAAESAEEKAEWKQWILQHLPGV